MAEWTGCQRCGQPHPKGCHGHVNLKDPDTGRMTGQIRACKLAPMLGQQVCVKHGGRAGHNRRAGAQRLARAEAARDLANMGVPLDTTPIEALEAMLCEAAGNVAFLRMLVAELDTAVYGPTFHATGFATGEAKPHVLVVMYNDERDRFARLAKDCAVLGLDERRVRLAEAQIARLFDAVTVALQVLPEAQRETVRAALVHELRERTAGPTPATSRPA